MGKIGKTNESRYRTPASKFMQDFQEGVLSTRLCSLPRYLKTFPQDWPPPRGDLQQWISVLDRFDEILESCVSQYGLADGPQLEPFGRKLIIEDEKSAGNTWTDDEFATHLSKLDLSCEPDKDVVEAVLDFSVRLMNQCANRSLYASSEHLSRLVNTTSFSILQAVLRLSFRLSRRYHMSKARNHHVPSMMDHYALNQQPVQILALPPDLSVTPMLSPSTPKGKEREHRKRSRSDAEDGQIHPWDLQSILGGEQDSGELRMTIEPEESDPVPESESSSPLAKRSSTFQTPTANNNASPKITEVVVSYRELREEELHVTLRKYVDRFPKEDQYKFMCRLREAKALVSRDEQDRIAVVSTRLLALAGLAFSLDETKFRNAIINPLAEHPRHYNLPQLVVGLISPPEEEGSQELDRSIQTAALHVLEALTDHRQLGLSMDVYYALGANVNHGVLFYLIRKAVAQLSETEKGDDDDSDAAWRDALFDLLKSVSNGIRTAAESLNQAGILQILNQVLEMRTPRAIATHWKILSFLDNFIMNSRDALPTFVNVHGLDVMRDLVAYAAEDSLKLVNNGTSMPESHKSYYVDFDIPFNYHLTLRHCLRIFHKLMGSQNATFQRQLRNLFDSRQTLDSLNIIISRPSVFGSLVWSVAVNFLSSFLNNEPTSYSIIAEAGLNEAFIKVLDQRVALPTLQILGPDEPLDVFPESLDVKQEFILPVADSLQAIPNGISALCLNENGLKHFQKSKALANFLDIFQSPQHMEAFSKEESGTMKLGKAFDELVRHHPHESTGLKGTITSAVLQMLENVDYRCRIEAYNYGFGSKAYVNDGDKVIVAGGRKALSGIDHTLDGERLRYRQQHLPQAGINGANGDIDMDDADDDVDLLPPNPTVTLDAIQKNHANAAKLKKANASASIAAAIKFVIGFCSASQTRRSFIEAGGVQRILDLVTNPCHEFGRVYPQYYRDIPTLLVHLIDEQPYITVPAILQRLDSALDILSPFFSSDTNDDETPYFAPFTKLPESGSKSSHASNPSYLENGTSLVKALTVVDILTHSLTYAFKEPASSPRQSPNLFQSCNFADVYVYIIAKLGKLNRRLVWESVHMESTLPQDWKRNDIFDREIVTAQSILQDIGYPQPSVPTDTTTPNTGAQYHNTVVFRSFYTKIPTTINLLFKNLGRLLMARRQNHVPERHNAMKVADQIARSVKEMLDFLPPRTTDDEKLRCSYWIWSLKTMLKVFLDERPTGTQPLTTLLLAFKNMEGFQELQYITDHLYDNYDTHKSGEAETQPLQDYRLGGLKLMLQFFASIVDHQQLQESPQTALLQSASRSVEKVHLDYFSSSQFIVELRLLAMEPVKKMWPYLVKDREPYKPLMQIVRLVLEAEGEQQAIKKSEKIEQKGKSPGIRLWAPRSTETVQRLATEYAASGGIELAMEALYRCGDILQAAEKYCAAQAKPELRNKRNPVPPGEMLTASGLPFPTSSLPPPHISALRSSLANRDSPESRREVSSSPAPSSSMAENSAEIDSPAQAPSSSTPGDLIAFSEGPEIVLPDFATLTAQLDARRIPPTVDDLELKRAGLRATLIEDCSTILAERDDVNFELRDLIKAANKSPSWQEENDVGDQIIALFLSLAELPDQAENQEDANKKAKQIGTITHFMALVFQDRELYKTKRENISEECLNPLLCLLERGGDATNYADFAPQVLLMLELILADDSQPLKITYRSPGADDPIETPGSPKPESQPLLALGPDTNREKKLNRIMSAVLSLVPHIKDNKSFAHYVARVLVILTRNRWLALQMARKDNLGRFFGMIRNLNGLDESLQGCVTLILRHIIEDDDIIRQIMRSEIHQYFNTSGRQPRSDTMSYVRHFSALTIRAPKIFVDVTNELCQINRWDVTKTSHFLELKEDAPLQDAPAHEDKSVPVEGKGKAKAVTSTAVPKEEQQEVKMPTLAQSEGLISFMLHDLLGLREEYDRMAPLTRSNTANHDDVEMTGNESIPPAVASPAATSDVLTAIPKVDEKPFKPEDHPTYMYRCFLLQALTELLASYNKAKIEFINYKAKLDPVGTPSKPRSSVFKYLLGNLLPVGTLSHESSITFKKREATSGCAILLINGLVTKTFENGPYPKREIDVPTRLDMSIYVEEPELLYVRHFVVDQCLRVLKETMESKEATDMKYSRILKVADLLTRMLTYKWAPNAVLSASNVELSQKMLAKIMYEKGIVASLTNVLGEIDLKVTGARRLVKYVLRPLKHLSEMANDLSAGAAVQAPDLDDDDDDGMITDEYDETYYGDHDNGPDVQFSSIEMYRPDDEEDVEMDSEDEDDDLDPYGENEYEAEMEFENVMDGPEADSDELDPDDMEDEDIGEGSEMDIDDDDNLDVITDDEDDEDNGSSESEHSSDDDDDENDDDALDHLNHVITGDIQITSSWTGGEDEIEEEDEDGDLDYDLADEVIQPGSQLDAMLQQAVLNLTDMRATAQQDPDNNDLGEIEHELGAHMPLIAGSFAYVDHGDSHEDIAQGPFGRIDMSHITDMPNAQDLDDEEDMDDVYEEDEEDEEDDEGNPFYNPGDVDVFEELEDNPEWAGNIPGRGRLALGGALSMQGVNVGGLFGMRGDVFDQPWHNEHSITFPHDPVGSRNRAHRNRATDEGTNPLLRPQQQPGHAPISHATQFTLTHDTIDVSALGDMGRDRGSLLSGLIDMIRQHGQIIPGQQIALELGGPGAPIAVTIPSPNGLPSRILGHHTQQLQRYRHRHHQLQSGFHHSSITRIDPAQSIRFEVLSTTSRWAEEARTLFSSNYPEYALNVVNSLYHYLVPPARKRAKEDEEAAEKRKLEEAQERARKEREEQERQEKERLEREEQEARERAEREAQEAAAAATAKEASPEDDGLMEGVETSQPEIAAAEPSEPVAGPSAPAERVMYRFGNREVDITSLGIDVDFLNELPEDMREEVLMGQLVQARATAPENTEYDQDFLDALPPEMRDELLQNEMQERRRREREAQRRDGRAGIPGGPIDMDNASFFASLAPGIRETILAEQGDDIIEHHLPAELAAEARRLGAGRRPPTEAHIRGFTRSMGITADGALPKEIRPRQYVQILDKAGVAALLRLMFMTQTGSAKTYLFQILISACQNKQNRAEILSTLLSILQDGSSDSGSVERSFAQLTARAKSAAVTKTPQKQTGTSVSTEMTPLNIMEQCLSAIFYLIQHNPKVMEFMLSEHEVSIGFKSRSGKKGKAKDTKASRYPINALLSLLDRKFIVENSLVMETLTTTLMWMTNALTLWEKKRAEIEAKQKEEDEKKAESSTVEGQTSEQPAPADQPTDAAEEPTADADTSKEAPATDPATEVKKQRMPPSPPEISDHNLRSVVNIFVARECTSKTFKSSLSLLSNLATIPKAKSIFIEELVRLAQELGTQILDELKELLVQVRKAESATDVLRAALSKFSPANSDQAKLYRIISCLDYIHDAADPKLREMFENDTYAQLWNNLSQCLTAIREHGSMVNVATILLPLIEVLMVVCKVPTMNAAETNQNRDAFDSLEMSISSLRDETSPLEVLFYKFTDEHKKILNDLIRQNPKLMSGSFSLLVKNSKILEFDNKREHFTRKLKNKNNPEMHGGHPALQVNVKRSTLFHDSYRSLYYKKPAELKYGKLNVKFSGEEAVDAGGVTREWFTELVKQMFNPNYALFLHIASDRTTFHPNENSNVNPEHLSFLKFIGNIIGKAVFEGRHLDCHFSTSVYKSILGKLIHVKDMEAHDPPFYKSLVWILENDVTTMDMTFTRDVERFGAMKVVDLKPGGADIKVTNENKREYVDLVTHQILVRAIKEQLDQLLLGFYEIIPKELISIFTEQELELLISGLPEIDIEDWKSNTEYHGYTANSPQITWFWRAVRSFDKEERAKLLQFATGTSKVPLNGFKELEGMNGFSRFNIHKEYSATRLPAAHTCFNQLDLPEYDSYEILRDHLLVAISQGTGHFGFV